MGTAGAISFQEEKAFKTMLELDTIRGPHSTGVLFVSNRHNLEVVKSLGTPWDLYCKKSFIDSMKGIPKVLLGHNRWATKGKINTTNAHPFELGDLVGAHNGTLTKQYLLDDSRDFEVDSENIYHHMDINGVADTAKKLAGAYALTWYDKKEHTINFLRNDERTLFYCYSEDRKTIFWASEPWMMGVALNRHKVKYQEIQEVKIDSHYSFEIPDGFGQNAKPFDKVRLRPVVPYENLQQKQWGHYGGGSHYAPNPPAQQGRLPATNPPKKDLSSYMDDELEFMAVAHGVNADRAPYISLRIVGTNTPMRAYKSKKSKAYDDLEDAIGTGKKFYGFAKGYVEKFGGYLILDHRTVGTEKSKEEGTTLFPGPDGTMLTQEEFNKAVKDGCGWCSGAVTPFDAGGLVWIDPQNFICDGCKDLPDVKEMFH